MNNDTQTEPLALRPKPMKDGRGAHLYKHGLSKTPEHKIWFKMRARSLNPNSVNYERYGGRGITVCERWNSFEAFLADMGPRPSNRHSLERTDNLLGYFPENCKWATNLDQANNKRNNVMRTFQGRTQSVAAWCRELGLNYALTRQRIYRDKWTPERAFRL